MSAVSRVCMPSCAPVMMTLRSWLLRPSRTMLRTGVGGDEHLERRDHAAADARDESLRHDRLRANPRAAPGSAPAARRGTRRRCGRRSARRRSCAASRTRGGRSRRASSVARMVSVSRISPTSMTSGSSRNAARRPRSKLSVSIPTSRWLTADRLLRCTYSIGSSIVTMWHGAVRVDLVDHRRQRRRLARAGRPGHEDEALREAHEAIRSPAGGRARRTSGSRTG